MSTTATARQVALRRAALSTGATIALTSFAVGAAVPAHADDSYTVRSGDTVSGIAARYGTTVSAVASASGLANPSRIQVGQVLTIPSSTPAPAAATPAAAPAAAPAATYTVVRGDTVSAIATRYGTTVAAIASANGLANPSLIRIGQVLSIPTSSSATAASTSGAALVGDTFAGRTYPAAVVASANANKAALLATGVPTTTQMRAIVEQTADAMGVDRALALAVAYQESGFNHASVSPANAIGTMQVIPSSGDWASQLVGRPLNLLDPNDNVVAGVAILRSLLASCPDRATAIASYYQGAASVKRNGMFADTQRYVANVTALTARFA
jgi:LysM repeat protein